jgi:hypothetical protein
MSNGVFFICNYYLMDQMMILLQGKAGFIKQLGTMVFYTAFTATGAIIAHYVSIHTEKGKAAVGASKKYAQITNEEWNAVKRYFIKEENKQESLVDAMLVEASRFQTGNRCPA